MDDLHKLHNQVTIRMFAGSLTVGLVSIATWLLSKHLFHFSDLQTLILCLFLTISISVLISSRLATMALNPLRFIWQAIIHVDPSHEGTPAPNLDELKMGHELVTNLALRVYQFASQQNSKELIDHRKELIQASSIVSNLPLPLFVFNKDLLVVNASNAALEYCQIKSADLFGKPIFDNLDLEYPNEFTLEKWIEDCQDNKVTHTGYWERVRVRLSEDDIRQCDMSAYYNRDNPSGTDYIVTLFDRTAQYNEDDQSMSFVALAVHELRTPLTVLRGYIEVFEEELDGKLSDELRGFMLKMTTAADQLTSFVHNILNVARIDNNQLSLQLGEENWEELLTKGMADINMRAEAYGKTIELTVAKDLPTVAADRVSIYEVVTNLIDNAIKYSPDSSKRIIVEAKMNGDVVETTVQDFGVGVPESVLPNLFEKFYRNHRTRTQIGGTGLGLYLCKAITTAHGGQIWAKSKEGEGSTFGFTLIPYAKVDKDGTKEGEDIVRQANGWIKNHSYYRR